MSRDQASPLESISAKQPLILVRLAHSNMELKQGLLWQIRQFGWRLFDFRSTFAEVPHGIQPAGVIVDLPLDHPYVKWVHRLKCPVVRIGILPHPMDDDFFAVIGDLQKVGTLAAEHFAERGFAHVGFVGQDPWHQLLGTYEAFNRQSSKRGIFCDLLQLKIQQWGETTETFHERWDREITHWIQSLPKPVGLFTYNSQMAAHISMLTSVIGLAVPEDVALLGLGESPWTCEAAPVPLSSVDLGFYNLGCEALRQLRDLVHGVPKTNRMLVLPPAGIIERQSTNLLAVSDPVVAKALRYIWEHLEKELTVDQIARQLGVSLSVLERRFHKSLGRSISAERHRKRLERCAELLLKTDLTISEVGQLVGLGNAAYLYRSFRKTFGMTPRAYRLQHGKK